MFNPYLQEFNQIKHDMNDHKFRHDLVKQYAWAVPNNEAIEAIKTIGKAVLEIGAGSGYWAKVLSSVGVQVLAFDNRNGGYEFSKDWFTVNNGSVEQIKANADKALMLCWPNYDDPFAFNATIEYMRNKGKTLIYIGESTWGCTGCNKFHKLLDKCWKLEKVIDIPQWSMIHDRLYIYTRG